LSSLNSPFWKNQKPSGRVFIARTISPSVTAAFPAISNPEIASRRPSSTRNVRPTRSPTWVVSGRTRAR